MDVARKYHGDHGRFASPHTRAKAESALSGLLPRLAIYYSDVPWWKHDLWCLRFDPRIPRLQTAQLMRVRVVVPGVGISRPVAVRVLR